MKPGRAAASFDSATGMLRALSRHLAGREVPMLGQLPSSLELPASALLGGANKLPRRQAEALYTASGVAEAVPRDRTGEVDSDLLARWVVEHYPRQRYDVVFVGSANGAAIHLAAAVGAPWLPQTLLIPVRRRGVDRDDPEAEMRAGVGPAEALLESNPDLALHHMHDPNQDRLMIGGMSYFRVKWQQFPAAYRRFLAERLAPGGVVVSVECETQWPVTQVADRHFFQFGAFGGATAEEYHHGGPRVADLLREYGASRRRWQPPPADLARPEAEWGFDPSWNGGLANEVHELGGQLRRISFDGPNALSPAVADVYREWHRHRGVPNERMLLDCFLLLDPLLTVRTGSVPFWLAFGTRGSLSAAHEYLDQVGDFDEIRLMLFSHGTDSIGLAPVREWRELLRRADKLGSMPGVDRHAFPRDFAVFARAHRDLARVRHRYPVPEPMPWATAEEVLRERAEVGLTPA